MADFQVKLRPLTYRYDFYWICIQYAKPVLPGC